VSVRLLLLGLLKRRSLHGYEIKKLIEAEMADWSRVAVGSIYFALEKLASEGFLEKGPEEKPGNRPARSAYRITEAGRTEFGRLLRETWSELEPQKYSVDFGVAFLEELDHGELRGFLRRREAALTAILDRMAGHRGEVLADPEVPRAAGFIFSHHEAHYRAELAWTREILGSLGGE
jgi:DNA-binding PadR family transcriptional regulator